MPCINRRNAPCSWHESISGNAESNGTDSFVAHRRSLGPWTADDIEIFLQDVPSSTTPPWIQRSKLLCRDAITNAYSGDHLEGPRPCVTWIDDRGLNAAGAILHQKYENPLPTLGLADVLRLPPYTIVLDKNIVNGKRLIHQWNPNQNSVRALIETVAYGNALALRELLRHFEYRKTAMTVSFSAAPESRYSILLSFPIWRIASPDALDVREELPAAEFEVSPLDISSNGRDSWVLMKEHFSATISGATESFWTTYALETSCIDLEDLEYEPDTTYSDPIVGSDLLDANRPLWCLRLYALIMLEARIEQVYQAWRHIDDYIEGHLGTGERVIREACQAAFHEAAERHPEARIYRHLRWTADVIAFLKMLTGTLRDLNAEWTEFDSEHGDVKYFLCPSQSSSDYSRRYRDNVRQRFGRLRLLESSFERYIKRVQDLANVVEHRLAFESKRLARENNRLALDNNETSRLTRYAQEFTVVVLLPFALNSAYFAMPQVVIPFTANVRSFCLCWAFVFAINGIAFDAGVRRPKLWREYASTAGDFALGCINATRHGNLFGRLRGYLRGMAPQDEESIQLGDLRPQPPGHGIDDPGGGQRQDVELDR